jgi:hypothetical protein
MEVVVHQDEGMQGNAVILEGAAEQAPEVVAIVRVEEDRTLVDAALRDMQRDTWQFETRPSWHGSHRCEISSDGAATERFDLSANLPTSGRPPTN